MCTWGLDCCQVEKQMTLKDTTSAQGEWRGETFENRAYKFIGKDKYKYHCVFQEVLQKKVRSY